MCNLFTNDTLFFLYTFEKIIVTRLLSYKRNNHTMDNTTNHTIPWLIYFLQEQALMCFIFLTYLEEIIICHCCNCLILNCKAHCTLFPFAAAYLSCHTLLVCLCDDTHTQGVKKRISTEANMLWCAIIWQTSDISLTSVTSVCIIVVSVYVHPLRLLKDSPFAAWITAMDFFE